MSDFNSGGFTMQIDPKKSIRANINRIQIKSHFFENVQLRDFMNGLAERLKKRDPSTLNIKKASEGCVHRKGDDFALNIHKTLGLNRFFDRIARFLPEDSIVVAETGMALWSAAETLMPHGTTFISQAFYCSIGYTIGATLGAAMAARNRHVFLFVGDGSLQVTCQDISTMIRNNLTPTIFVINNDGYTIERLILDGPFNDIQPWKYSKLPEVFMGGSTGYDTHTEGELEEALKKVSVSRQLNLLDVHVPKMECSDAVKRSASGMAKSNNLQQH